jgi:S1-C subfamily serine protease
LEDKLINNDVYRTVRNGVCAVGYLTEPLEIYRQNIKSAIFQVIGTGFLVEKTTILTNRHVIRALLDKTASLEIPHTQLFIQFVVPGDDGKLQIVPRLIRQIYFFDDPLLDLGLIRYRIVKEEHFQAIAPVRIVDKWNLRVSEEVGVCGYPYGTTLLAGDTTFRWGPVVQQGHISAISPFDTTDVPDDILLDVRTAGGMSGAPIFRPDSGEVLGVHYAGIEATTAFGIPLTNQIVESALSKFNQHSIDLNEP